MDDELWNRVQQQRALKKRLGIQRIGGLERTKRSQQYLFSGLLFCGLCGRRISIVDNNDYGATYGCGLHRYKGACANATRILRDRLEEQLLRWLTRDLFQSSYVEQAAKCFYMRAQKRMTELQAEARKNAVNLPELRRDLEAKKQEAWNITDFIVANGRHCSPIIQSRLEAAEARIKQIEEQLSRANDPLPNFALSSDEIKERILSALRDLQTVLTSQTLVGKQVVRKHIAKVILTPGQSDGKRVCVVSIEFALDGGGNSGVLLTGSVDASMQQYGFNTITVTGLVLDTRVGRKRRTPVPNESAGDASAVTASVSV